MEETALRLAILESPNDDLPKLVFADWLDENVRAIEAMFIRHYVLIGGVNYGSHGWWGDGGGGTIDGGGGGDSGNGESGDGSATWRGGGDGDAHGDGDWGDGDRPDGGT